jgi:hypothetical protein
MHAAEGGSKKGGGRKTAKTGRKMKTGAAE